MQWMCNFKSDYFVCVAVSVIEYIFQFFSRLPSLWILIIFSFIFFFLFICLTTKNICADDKFTTKWCGTKEAENIVYMRVCIWHTINSMSWNENSHMSIVWPIWKQPLSSPWNSINFTMLTYFREGKLVFLFTMRKILCLLNGFWRHIHLSMSMRQVAAIATSYLFNAKIFLNPKIAYRFFFSHFFISLLASAVINAYAYIYTWFMVDEFANLSFFLCVSTLFLFSSDFIN